MQWQIFIPDLKHNDDYTSIVNQKHFDRLQGLLTDAKEKGAQIDEINPANEDFSQQEAFKIPPTLVMNPTDDMEIMKEEIFGPLLPIKEFTEIDETISYVNKNDKPLGLYYFGSNKNEEDHVFSQEPHQAALLLMMYWVIFSKKICLLVV